MGGLYRHFSVMQAGWNVVRCSSGAFFIGGRRMFPFDTCAAGVATHRTDVQAIGVTFFVNSGCLKRGATTLSFPHTVKFKNNNSLVSIKTFKNSQVKGPKRI